MKIPEAPPPIPNYFHYGDVLDDLVKIRKFRDFFQINENQYPYWEKWKYIAREWGYDEKKLWAAVRIIRGGNNLQLTSSYLFKINAPSLMQKYVHEFDINLGGSIQSDGIIPSQEKERYLLSSLMEEAIASSQLEGAVTTRKLAKEMLETNRKPRNESEQMIANNYEGMKWIVRNKNKPFTIDNILELHGIITRNTLANSKDEGAFRSDDTINVVDVQTGEIVHMPPSFERLQELMLAFCDFANEKEPDRFFVHPITRGIILHFLLGFIHPFADGNGRTARSVFYWYLVKKGYWLVEYMSVSRVILQAKAQYARAYLHTELDNNDLTYFILYNLRCLQIALKELKKYIERKTKEKDSTIGLLRNTVFNDRQISLLQEIIHDQSTSFSVNQLQQWFKVSNQTARNDLNELANAGLLEFRKSGKQLRFFATQNFTQILSAMQGQH
jgi:Fic family protein